MRALTLLCLLVAGTPGLTIGQDAGPIAVVVHPAVDVTDLSFADLRRIVLGDREFWPSGERVTILLRAPVAREREVAVRDICDMTEAKFRQHWISKVFRAETPSGPMIVYSTEMALQQAAQQPGALTFVPASMVDDTVKVVSIDGRRPGDAGYRFQ